MLRRFLLQHSWVPAHLLFDPGTFSQNALFQMKDPYVASMSQMGSHCKSRSRRKAKAFAMVYKLYGTWPQLPVGSYLLLFTHSTPAIPASWISSNSVWTVCIRAFEIPFPSSWKCLTLNFPCDSLFFLWVSGEMSLFQRHHFLYAEYKRAIPPLSLFIPLNYFFSKAHFITG